MASKAAAVAAAHKEKAMAGKLKEADDRMREGDKALKKSITKWKPDWNKGAMSYEAAANIYRTAGEVEKCVYAWRRASKCYEEMGILYKAGTHLEACAKLYRDKNVDDKAEECYMEAVDVFARGGKIDKAAECLDRAAKLQMERNPERAAELFEQAIEFLDTGDRQHYMGDPLRSAIAFALKQKLYPRALELLDKLAEVMNAIDNPGSANKAFLSKIVVHLFQQDMNGANLALESARQVETFANTEFEGMADEMIQHFAARNEEGLNRLINIRAVAFLETQVARMAKTLPKLCVTAEEDIC
uniref:Gamma-soluble NSF attachment protein n=1 Tax=Palpitomonas bilix TaxID=652834 RepID=A0A7S3D0B0_9EUKA|mmetsp:Transcript_16924/g.42494  ORF Transcript_16924/g.42494 Transcript_16924/m.42494 type:complete len:301 (+) Transcript_16924:111-1013(+)